MVARTKNAHKTASLRSGRQPLILTLEAAGQELGCSARTIRRWRTKGLLKGCVVNGRPYITTESIDALVELGKAGKA